MTTDQVAGAVGLLAGAVVVLESIRLGVGGPVDPGPGFFPTLAGSALAAISATLLLAARGGAPIAIDRRAIAHPASLGGAMLAYAVLFEPLGYPAATLVIAFVLLRMQAVAWRKAVLASAALSVATFVVFAGLLDVELPTGLAGRLLP